MQIPDLIVVGFSQHPGSIDMFDSLKLIKNFRRMPHHVRLVTNFHEYPNVNVMTVTIDDPEFYTEDLHVLFLLTPSEQQYDVIKNDVRSIEKSLSAWFHGNLYQVEHKIDKTLCYIGKTKHDNEEKEIPPGNVEGFVWDVFQKWQTERNSTSTTLSHNADVSEPSADSDDRDHSLPDGGD